ncbi:MAG: metallopeptidase TldD-related protein [Dehalococcoidales bacterium]|nr:metallopeptidase TldD-related protein [Dehalococcoidales bacterium]
MEEVLAMVGKVAEAAEVFSVSLEETSIHFEANRLKRLQTKQQTSVALRIIRQGRTGYATSTNLDNRQQLVDSAVETSQFGMAARFELPGYQSYPHVDTYDASVETVSNKTMIDLGEAMVTAVTGHTPGILCDGGAERGSVAVRIINSRGGDAIYRKSFFDLGIEGTLINGTDMLFVGHSESSCRPILETERISKAVTRQLDLAKNMAAAPTKPVPVIFTPDGVAGALILSLIAAFNGKTVLEGASPIGGKLGQQAFDTKLNLYDDATLPYRPNSRPCDDEGVTSQRTPLIEAGVVANFLYDLQTAARAGKKSTGNGHRSGGLPSPSPSTFTIAPGNTSFDDMVRGIDEGLVIERLLGAEQGNILGGDFSGNVLLGYKIEKGRLVGRVKNIMVSGNVYQMLKEVTLGSEAKWVGGFIQTPHLFFPSISVASKE